MLSQQRRLLGITYAFLACTLILLICLLIKFDTAQNRRFSYLLLIVADMGSYYSLACIESGRYWFKGLGLVRRQDNPVVFDRAIRQDLFVSLFLAGSGLIFLTLS